MRVARSALEPLSADASSAFWARIAPVNLSENVTGGAPFQATRVRTAWDLDEWRVLFDADDARPWATITERDGPIWTEEVVEVFFDPVGDLEGYFEIEVNPLGTVTDLVLRRIASGWRKDFRWCVEGLRSRVEVRAGGWAAELAIPFAAVGPARLVPGATWRANFLRIDRPGGPGTEAELSAWSPTGIPNFHRAEYFGRIEWVDAAGPAGT